MLNPNVNTLTAFNWYRIGSSKLGDEALFVDLWDRSEDVYNHSSNSVQEDYRFLCFVVRAFLYNLVNKVNLVHNLFLVYLLILRLLMSYIYIYIYIYIYGAPILDVSRSHTTTHHSR